MNTHHIHSSSDDEVEFKDGGFHQDSSLQQVRHIYVYIHSKQTHSHTDVAVVEIFICLWSLNQLYGFAMWIFLRIYMDIYSKQEIL